MGSIPDILKILAKLKININYEVIDMTSINSNKKWLELLLERWAERFMTEGLTYVEIPLVDMERQSNFDEYSKIVYCGKLGEYTFDGIDYMRGVVKYSIKK